MKHIIIIIALCLCSQLSTAQFPEMFKSSNQQIIEDAVREGLIFVRQDYRLKDVTTGDFYGRGKNNYFGRNYALAVRVRGGFYTSLPLQPWNNDPNYEKYRDDSSKKPVICETDFRLVDDVLFNKSGADWNKSKKEGSLLFVSDSTSHGFKQFSNIGEQNGWIVLITSDGDWTTNDSLPFSFDIYKTAITITEGENSYSIKTPSTTRKILGGIYVVPVVSSIGQINFMLTGWVNEVDGNWKITTFAKKNNELNIKGEKDEELNLIQDDGVDGQRPRSRKQRR